MFELFIHWRSQLATACACATLAAGCGSEQKFTNRPFQKTPPDQQTYEANATAITGSAERQESPQQNPEIPVATIQPTEPPVTPVQPVNPPDVTTLCAISPRKTRVVPVAFPESKGQCPWSVGTNLPAKDGIVRARTEEFVTLNLNEREKICGIKVSSPQQQTIKFDDELTLTFNDVVLLSSYDYSSRYTTMDGMPVYSWAAIKNAFNPGPETPRSPFCINSPNEPTTDCMIPQTQIPGLFKLNVPADVSAKLSEKALAEKRATLGLIVTGDDNAADCYHSEIKLDIELEYVDAP